MAGDIIVGGERSESDRTPGDRDASQFIERSEIEQRHGIAAPVSLQIEQEIGAACDRADLRVVLPSLRARRRVTWAAGRGQWVGRAVGRMQGIDRHLQIVNPDVW